MKINFLKTIMLFLFLTNNLFASDLLSVDNSQKFNFWIKKENIKYQYVGIGYSEGVMALKYTVNTSPIPLDSKPSNFYTTFEANDYRVEAYETYDILKNYGFKPGGFYIKPGIGFGVDTASGSFSGFGVLNFDYNFKHFSNWIISFQIKGFFLKQHNYTTQTLNTFNNGKADSKTVTVCNDNDSSDTKIFTGITIGYKF